MGNSNSSTKGGSEDQSASASQSPTSAATASAASAATTAASEEVVRPVSQVVCDYDELADGQMKEFEIEGKNILLARESGNYYAVSAKCTHFGAPLVKGALCKGRLRCPWHGACFNIATGDIEDFPGLDSLQTFDLDVEEGKVKIHTNTTELATTKRVKSMMGRDLECTLLYLIVGGGPAALECAESLRHEGYKGKILIVGKEDDSPYDRTKLSKQLTATGKDLALRPTEFYEKYNISVMHGMVAFKVDTEFNHCVFRGGKYTDYTIEYDQMCIATGTRPTRMDKPGMKMFPNQILYLRTPADANKIAEKTKDQNVVVVGSSFIGMEIASYLSNKAKSVMVVGRSPCPFIYSLGEEIGQIVLKLFKEKGVKFQLKTEIKSVSGESMRLTEILLANGETIQADYMVMGLGTIPNTEFLAGSDVELTERGHIKVNQYMQTSVDLIHAAGDCASFPLFLNKDEEMSLSVGHFHMALAHGKCAGANMCFKEEPLKTVPYFWTVLFGKSIRFCGFHARYDDTVFHGDDGKFVLFYIRAGNVVAAASLSWDPIVSVVAELLRAEIAIPADSIKESPNDITKLMPK